MEEQEKTILDQQEKALEKMAEERRQLFESLGVSESKLIDALKDKRNFSPETWKLMQQKRQELEELLDKKIAATQPKKEKKLHSPPRIDGHWIHVR